MLQLDILVLANREEVIAGTRPKSGPSGPGGLHGAKQIKCSRKWKKYAVHTSKKNMYKYSKNSKSGGTVARRVWRMSCPL